jgi:membrane-bound transcription factor site-1 protease
LVLDIPDHDLPKLEDLSACKGYYVHQKVNRKPLTYLSGNAANKPFDLLGIDDIWSYGTKGQGVKVAVFDSGVGSELEGVKMCKDFTNDRHCGDASGHGTFITSILTSRDLECPGLVPDAEVYMFKVFNTNSESYTAWFLEAFNYALHLNINIINLSTGGIDFTDVPFTEKVREVVNAGITVVSAIGNDGPGHGTLSNPGD